MTLEGALWGGLWKLVPLEVCGQGPDDFELLAVPRMLSAPGVKMPATSCFSKRGRTG